jgi:hypothetical protein
MLGVAHSAYPSVSTPGQTGQASLASVKRYSKPVTASAELPIGHGPFERPRPLRVAGWTGRGRWSELKASGVHA